MHDRDDFEIKLHEAFLRRPAPPGLKQRILNARSRRRTDQHRSRVMFWQKLAACFVLVAVIGGGLTWRHIDQERKGQAARDEVITALRITNHALDEIQARLAARDRADQE
jgi:hypothetical protein